jgi:hypothetical protein
MKSFKRWLKQNRGEDNRYNDLLIDAESDEEYPWDKNYEGQMRYLIRKACMECLETLRDAYFDYLTDEL